MLSAGSKITGFVPTDQVVRQGENRERGKAGVMGSSVLEHMHDVYPKEALARDIKQERCSLRWTEMAKSWRLEPSTREGSKFAAIDLSVQSWS